MILLLLSIFLFNIAACEEKESTTNNDSTNDSTNMEVDDAKDDEWDLVKENVYDISKTFALPNNISISDVDFINYFIIGYDFEKNEYAFIPFDNEKYIPNISHAIYIPETKSENGLTVKYSIIKNYFVFIKGRAWEPTKTVKVYSSKNGALINEWQIEQNITVSIDNDKIILIRNDGNIQNMQYIDPVSLNKNEIINWDISQKTTSPDIDTFKIGKKGFAFTGTIYPNVNSQNTTCFGLISNDKKVHMLETMENFRFLEYESGIMIYDSDPIYGSENTPLGHFELYDANLLEKKVINPETKNETYSRVHLSKSGKYLLTGGLLDEDKCLRLYDTTINKIKYKYTFDTQIEDPIMEIISISEDQNAILVVIKSKNTTKTYLLIF